MFRSSFFSETLCLAGSLALCVVGMTASAMMANAWPIPVDIAAIKSEVLAQDQDRTVAADHAIERSEDMPLFLSSEVSGELASLAPMKLAVPAIVELQPVETSTATDHYLCEVYRRTPVKQDPAGDFTWKDKVAAQRLGMDLCEYVIGGMDEDFREKLARLGHRLDAAPGGWSILSGFRDDYRQKIASGFKASDCNSYHGGTCATGGYGHGRAVDVSCSDGTLDCDVLRAIDRLAGEFGLARPLPSADPPHVQLAGARRDAGHQEMSASHKMERSHE